MGIWGLYFVVAAAAATGGGCGCGGGGSAGGGCGGGEIHILRENFCLNFRVKK